MREGGVKPRCFSPMLRMRPGAAGAPQNVPPMGSPGDFSEGPGARVGGMGGVAAVRWQARRRVGGIIETNARRWIGRQVPVQQSALRR